MAEGRQGDGVGSLKSRQRQLKEAYAVRRTVPPSTEIEEQIDRLLAVGVGENPRESLSELAKLGARLIIQRAVEDEFDAWLGRARYERRPDYQRGLRNGFRPRRVQTAEDDLVVAGLYATRYVEISLSQIKTGNLQTRSPSNPGRSMG
jgi:hypothetical protein